jgi:hypothetical protein
MSCATESRILLRKGLAPLLVRYVWKPLRGKMATGSLDGAFVVFMLDSRRSRAATT